MSSPMSPSTSSSSHTIFSSTSTLSSLAITPEPEIGDFESIDFQQHVPLSSLLPTPAISLAFSDLCTVSQDLETLQVYAQNASTSKCQDGVFEFASRVITQICLAIPPGHCTDKRIPMLHKRCYSIIKRLAASGFIDAQVFLGTCLVTGVGTFPPGQPNPSKGYKLLSHASKSGHAEASYKVAYCRNEGLGCRKDSQKARNYLHKAASLKHPKALAEVTDAGLNSINNEQPQALVI